MPIHKKRTTKRINKVRRASNPEFYSGLQQIVRELEIVQAIIVCASEMLRGQLADYDPELSLVLRRCASDRLHDQIKLLSELTANNSKASVGA